MSNPHLSSQSPLVSTFAPMAESTPGSKSAAMSASSAQPSRLRRQPRQARSQERVSRILTVAQELFVANGYQATTTNAIAAKAQVPIGSLYQFFPDKSAILQALAVQYAEQLHHHLAPWLDPTAVVNLPLPTYVEQLIDAVDQFYQEQPGYNAIFMEVQGSIPELEDIEEAADSLLIQDLSAIFTQRYAYLTSADGQAMAYVLVKAVGTLLWLSLGQESQFRHRLLAETKRMACSYLQSYSDEKR
jgi:AcrR family transcriptional regulator